MQDKKEEAPPSTDLEGWREAIAKGLLGTFRPEALLRAVQDLGPDADQAVLNPIARRLSQIIMGIARRYVGTNKPNMGLDIIHRVHSGIWAALLNPESEDGRTMRDGLGGIVKFRCISAIAAENKHSRIPLEPKLREVKSQEEADKVPTDRQKARDVSHLVAAVEPPQRSAANEGFQGDDAVSAGKPAEPEQFHGMRQLEEGEDVKRLLARISDDRKRLAFRLYMDGYPFGSTKTPSMASAIGVSAKTAETWIAELIEFLQQTDEFKEMMNKKVGS